MSLSNRQPTLLSMLTNPTPSEPRTPTKSTTTPDHSSPNRTELEPTPLLLALDMQAERKRLRRRTDSVVTGAEDYIDVEKEEEEESGEGEGKKMELLEVEEGDGKQVIIPVKEDLSQLALLGRSVSSGFWNGVEGVRRGVWGVVGWS
ncbi:hypothetical protein OPT61_g855 [Boeremia exigua]|uniref:Uncharacterized protein n=1 Tax=Boeremia exigua TaxID=749465 RepID=A0ACC2ISF6_9PLEO|nr:hypothetical protein OPT61_g855 [Boeremia exigua]